MNAARGIPDSTRPQFAAYALGKIGGADAKDAAIYSLGKSGDATAVQGPQEEFADEVSKP